MKKILVIVIIILLSGCKNIEDSIIKTNLNEGYDIITVGDTHVDTGCVITIGNEKFNMEVIRSSVNTEEIGDYIISYGYYDGETTHYCLRYVKVIDDISPIASLNPGVDTVNVGKIFIDSGISYSDNYDLELDVEIDNDVDINTPGRYIITYTVVDDSLNFVEITRIVNVIN